MTRPPSNVDSGNIKDARSDAANKRAIVVERGLAIFSAFKTQRRLTIVEISDLIGLNSSTTRRHLNSLKTLGYVENSGRYFSLTPKILILAQAYYSSCALPCMAQTCLEHLSRDVGEYCSVSVLAGDEIMTIASAPVRKRSMLPAYCTSMGRVLLSGLSEPKLDGYFERAELKKYNRRTVTDERAIRRILHQVRDEDFSVVDGELDGNLRRIAVPVRSGSGKIVAAAHIGVDTDHANGVRFQKVLLPKLRQTAWQITHSLPPDNAL